MDSSSLCQNKHLSAKDWLFLWTWSTVQASAHITFHAKKLTVGGMWELQMTLIRKETKSPNSKNFPLFDSMQSTLSFSSLYTLISWHLKRNHSTLSTSQSLKGQDKHIVQLPLSIDEFQTSITHASFETAKANKEGKVTHNKLFL